MSWSSRITRFFRAPRSNAAEAAVPLVPPLGNLPSAGARVNPIKEQLSRDPWPTTTSLPKPSPEASQYKAPSTPESSTLKSKVLRHLLLVLSKALRFSQKHPWLTRTLLLALAPKVASAFIQREHSEILVCGDEGCLFETQGRGAQVFQGNGAAFLVQAYDLGAVTQGFPFDRLGDVFNDLVSQCELPATGQASYGGVAYNILDITRDAGQALWQAAVTVSISTSEMDYDSAVAKIRAAIAQYLDCIIRQLKPLDDIYSQSMTPLTAAAWPAEKWIIMGSVLGFLLVAGISALVIWCRCKDRQQQAQAAVLPVTNEEGTTLLLQPAPPPRPSCCCC